MNLLAQIVRSCVMIFNICYHAGGSTKHLRPPKVERRNEESSPSDALTPKKRKTRLAGKMRTYLYPYLYPYLYLYLYLYLYPTPSSLKQGVPSDEDLGWLYPICLLYEKEFLLELFARLQSRDINDMSPNPFTWR